MERFPLQKKRGLVNWREAHHQENPKNRSSTTVSLNLVLVFHLTAKVILLVRYSYLTDHILKPYQGVKLIFFSDSNLAPKFFKVVANSKKVGRHF